jgi:hypothetical protein
VLEDAGIARPPAQDVGEFDDDVWFLGTGVGAAQRVLDDLEQLLAA